ncbi:MAG: hypothetical protein J07HR59_00164, partial [Halorubrum sp. J07HR59]
GTCPDPQTASKLNWKVLFLQAAVIFGIDTLLDPCRSSVGVCEQNKLSLMQSVWKLGTRNRGQ